jgi:hypothetical protein
MADIVERLRQMAGSISYGPVACLEFKKAADEIDRLRTVVVRYGNRLRMSRAEPMGLQQSIDDAFTHCGEPPAPQSREVGQ